MRLPKNNYRLNDSSDPSPPSPIGIQSTIVLGFNFNIEPFAILQNSLELILSLKESGITIIFLPLLLVYKALFNLIFYTVPSTR